MKKIIILLSALLVTNTTNACVRVDLDDRTPEEVVRKSLTLAKQNPYSKATVAIWVDDIGFGTGIALDPYTILTAAHLERLGTAKKIHIISNDNAQTKVEQCFAFIYADPKAIIHDHFLPNPCANEYPRGIRKKEDGSYEMDGKPLTEIENTSFHEFHQERLMVTSPFFGIDLAILKLKEPLPDGIAYPEFLPPEMPIENKYGVSLGFGPMKFNQPQGATMVFSNPYDQIQRHLISVRVSAFECVEPFTKFNLKLLYSAHKGLLVNGADSFIPEPGMMRTEGIPVDGDSGGPLFIEHNNQYKLAGTLSSFSYSCSSPIEAQPFREEFKSIRQPIYPTWVDVRHPEVQDWIKKHMGPRI